MAESIDRTIDSMDGVTLILGDHRIIEGLFDRYVAATDDADRLALAAKILEELSLHATAEEHALYPVVRTALPDGEEHYRHSLAEHQEARETLAALETTPIDDASFDERMRTLIDDMRHHHEDEERDLLHPLRATLDEEQRRQLGREIRRAKRAAPVRPTVDSGAGAPTADELAGRAEALDLEGRGEMSVAELSDELERGGEDD